MRYGHQRLWATISRAVRNPIGFVVMLIYNPPMNLQVGNMSWAWQLLASICSGDGLDTARKR